MKPGYRPPLTPWEDQEYRGGVWHTAMICGLFLLVFISLL